MSANPPSATKTKNLIVTRLFDAPVELVWKAWTDPQHVMRWWGPNYFSSPSCEMDFREGGTSVVCMRAPKEFGGGQDMYSTWTYQKIVPMQRIEYIQNLSNQAGRQIDPASLGLRADFPQDVRTVITFKPIGDQTEMTIAQYGFPEGEMFEMAEMGLNQSLDKMAATFAEGI